MYIHTHTHTIYYNILSYRDALAKLANRKRVKKKKTRFQKGDKKHYDVIQKQQLLDYA